VLQQAEALSEVWVPDQRDTGGLALTWRERGGGPRFNRRIAHGKRNSRARRAGGCSPSRLDRCPVWPPGPARPTQGRSSSGSPCRRRGSLLAVPQPTGRLHAGLVRRGERHRGAPRRGLAHQRLTFWGLPHPCGQGAGARHLPAGPSGERQPRPLQAPWVDVFTRVGEDDRRGQIHQPRLAAALRGVLQRDAGDRDDLGADLCADRPGHHLQRS